MLLSFPHNTCLSSTPKTIELSLLQPTPFFSHLPPPRRALHPRVPPISTIRATAFTSHTALPKSAIQRIAEKLRSLGYIEDQEETGGPGSDKPLTGSGSAGEIFIPTQKELPKYRVGHTLDSSWSTPELPLPSPGTGSAILRFHELRRQVEKEKRNAPPLPSTVGMAAEMIIPPGELRRLRTVGIRIDKRLKVGKAGITEGIVNGIHERWRHSELVKIKCEDLCRMNMKRTHEILEGKTGGLVIWRSGSIIILYRGTNYKYPYFTDISLGEDDIEPSVPASDNLTYGVQGGNPSGPAGANSSPKPSSTSVRPSLVMGIGSPNKVRFQLPGEAQLEEEADRLLDGLGPRFTDWWGCEPLPVDADLLPAVVPGYRRPFRLLPFGLKPKLTDREMTILRRLARPLPCHFALGRNRNHQGLAASIIKLWEKCEIAKIAIKRGVQNTNSELMVEELKRLTGGTVLSRDREFIVFYRGKDFLPPAVSNAIEERRNIEIHKKNLKTNESSSSGLKADTKQSFSGSPIENRLHEANTQKSLSTEGRSGSAKSDVNVMDARLSRALEKKMKAEKLLEELEKSAGPPKQEYDREAISEEERFMLRKIGLRMKPFLLLGRRGVFDGTVENMHLHWKYRELVKIISKSRSFEDVHRTARTLEAESGGILVAVERVNKGHAIIVYRGKNYRRPKDLRPQTLLNKKAALKHYIEGQRHESLKLHVLKLSRDIEQLKDQLVKHDAEIDDATFEPADKSDTEKYADEKSNNEDEEVQEDHMKSGKQIAFNDISIGNSSMDPQADLIHAEHENLLPMTEVVRSYTEPSLNENITHAEQKDWLSLSSMSVTSNVSRDSSCGASNNKMNSAQCKLENKRESNGGRSFKATMLSNKERLILRKQALKMRKRPVLAVGRNNVVDGVAKTIKTHFRKWPLAIVNIKGIAKGTSVQEVVFELERATGAVLVSREPSKIILYRGWGEGEEPGGAIKEKLGDERKASSRVDEIPPQLKTAIKIESGLTSTEKEETQVFEENMEDS